MKFIFVILFFGIILSCNQHLNSNAMEKSNQYKIHKSPEEWKNELSPEQYMVLREAATESPGTGKYYTHFEEGIYKCAGCGEPLFSSESKFNSNCGWPSFDQEIVEGKIIEKTDTSHGMIRTEILCSKCGGHLGHVFDDGPTQTGLRYCVNSVSLNFAADDDK